MTDIPLLIKKYLKDELDESEKRELETWKNHSAINLQIFEELIDDDYLISAVNDGYKIESDLIALDKIHAVIDGHQQTEGTKKAKIKSIWPRLAAAAVILFAVALSSIYLLRQKNEKPADGVTAAAKQDVAPGSYKATLKLADGKSIVLDSATNGQLAQQGNTQVINKNGQLAYAPSSGVGKNEILWNTLSTAKGQTYPLLLSDGSRVWLNSESSIRFPVAFEGDLREVEITGEVFFEVAHNAKKPFEVTAGNMNVKVLGTTFNVNAYGDEDVIRTTLIEGSVQVTKGIQRKNIKPGQQAQVLPNEIKIVDKVDVDKITAWKQGYFMFKEDKLSEAIKNIARWYNVDVVFEGNAANVDVSGTIPRTANLSEVVKLLALIDVNARIEGRKLILRAE